jgi:dTDP-glucose 4,6-dehydratase
MSTLLVTGGAGFIGANFVNYWRRFRPSDSIIILDALTYAGNFDSISALCDSDKCDFVRGDICDPTAMQALFRKHDFDIVVHFAAESHVDRSIYASQVFTRTNVQGTHVLLDAALTAWKSAFDGRRFHHISTDEVFGSLDPGDAPWTERSRYEPRSPYAASKAASDFLVRSYVHTHGLPATITNCSNNYGPYQFPEKLLPLMIVNALTGQNLPIYGDGGNIRDWLYVEDHCAAIALVLQRGQVGETYNVGGGNELRNIELVGMLCDEMDRRFAKDEDLAVRFPDCLSARGRSTREAMGFVSDRPGHDRRYAICADKLSSELGFRARTTFVEGLAKTLDWYLANEAWWRRIQSGAYRDWMRLHYGAELKGSFA